MVTSAGGRLARGLAVSLACLALPATASAAVSVRKLGTSTQTVTIGPGSARSCLGHHTAGSSGVDVRSWTAKADGAVRIRLAGGPRDDWDLNVFRTSSGRSLGASQAWGANEVVDAVVRKGDSLTIQICRLGGPSARLPLQITEVATPLAQAGQSAPTESLVAIPLASQADFTRLENLGINLNEVPNGNVAPAVIEGPADAAKITAAGYTYKTLIPDVAKAERGYRAHEKTLAAAAAPSALPSGRNEYRTYESIQADLKKIVADHPGLARPVTLPKKSFQGRDLTGVEISRNVGAVDDNKPIFFLMGEHHAREWPSAEIPVEFALYLTSNKEARTTALLKKVRIVIVPVINPDGYIASRGAVDPADNSGDPQGLLSLGEAVAPPGGSLAYRRKNCDGASPDPSTPCSLQYGVDPNRNYGQYWGGPGAGTDPNSQTYRGTDQWSEPETQAVHEFSRTHDVTTLVTMHNFASLVLRPPGLHTSGVAPDEDALKALGDRMAEDTGYVSEYGFQLYDTTGTTEDWNYAAAGTFGYTIEMGPSADKGGNFHISYDRAVVHQWTGEETEKGKGKGLRDALLAAGEAGASRTDFSTLQGTAPPGSQLRLHKDFETPTSDPICAFETTDVSCPGGFEPGHSAKDLLDYTTVVPSSGKFSWIVTPSTRPFELKKGKTEQWTLTCEIRGSNQVLETRKITVDRGQTLTLDLPCGSKGNGGVTPGRSCVDKRKLALRAHTPGGGRLTRIDVFVNDKRVLRLRGSKARRGRIVLSRLKALRGRYKVTVIAYGTHGYRRVSTRLYKGCKKGKPHTVHPR